MIARRTGPCAPFSTTPSSPFWVNTLRSWLEMSTSV
jgi:hypothetical protein